MRSTVSGLTRPGLATIKVAERAPPCVGVNVTFAVQLEFAPSIPPVRGQVVPVAEIAKSPRSVPPILTDVRDTLEFELLATVI